MLFAWFNAEKSKNFGEKLAELFVEKSQNKKKLTDKEFTLKTQQSLKKVTLEILAFKRENSLNIYQKAQLGNAFKWKLKEEGFDPDYIDKLTEWLMIQLS